MESSCSCPFFGDTSPFLATIFGALCEWPCPPFTSRTNFSTIKKAIKPAKTQRPTAISEEWSWWCSPSWLCWWEWECSWPSPLPCECGEIAWGIRWRNASPRRPPEAKARRIFNSGCCSAELLWSGIKNKMKKGAALISKVAPIAWSHLVVKFPSRDGSLEEELVPWWMYFCFS